MPTEIERSIAAGDLLTFERMIDWYESSRVANAESIAALRRVLCVLRDGKAAQEREAAIIAEFGSVDECVNLARKMLRIARMSIVSPTTEEDTDGC